MICPVKFVCTQCLLQFREDHNWDLEHSWTDLNKAIEHLRENPTHEIEAEVEITL